MITNFKNRLFINFIYAFLLQSLLGLCFAQNKIETSKPPLKIENSLKQYLQSLDNNESTRYTVAYRQLSSRKKLAAIVYLYGEKWCGSGGCNTLVLDQSNGIWKIVATISITRLPIRILKGTSHGWRNIGIWVQGGGIQPGFEAELRFDGKTYPKNPTALPYRQSSSRLEGEVAIMANQPSLALYDN